MNPETTAEQDRIRTLAQSVDCITEADLNLLTGTTPGTTESWRKRGKGPAYVLIGNRYLYPRTAVADFVLANVRKRDAVSMKGLL